MLTATVFIAGSRAIARLNDAVRQRLDNVMTEGHAVVIGDANGADRVVQQYLADHRYANVTVYCTGASCRNNVAGWPTVAVAPPTGVHGGFEFYAVKDREMAAAASHGLMLWDGDSRGTLGNIRNLVAAQKPVVVYMSPTREFITVRTSSDVAALVDKAGPFALAAAKRRA